MACDHWTSRVIEKGEDPYGLGQWSFLVLCGRSDIRLVIVMNCQVLSRFIIRKLW
jgi:hypothetical protein